MSFPLQIFCLILIYLASFISSYLLGSISWAIIISKYFYHIDITKVGSGNAGGTNVGRYCGKKAAYAVIILDVLKTVIATWSWFFIVSCTPIKDFIYNINPNIPLASIYYLAGLSTAIGHSYSIFHHFKGGKCVSCYGGFCLCTNYMLAIIGITIFLIVLAIRKRVSLSSIIGVTCVLIASLAFGITNIYYPNKLEWMYYFNNSLRLDPSYVHTIFIFIFTTLVILKHKSNIKRLVNNTEPETHYKKD